MLPPNHEDMVKYFPENRIFQTGMIVVLVLGLLAFVLPALSPRFNNLQTKKSSSQDNLLRSVPEPEKTASVAGVTIASPSALASGSAIEVSSGSATLSAEVTKGQILPEATSTAAPLISERVIPPSPYDDIFREEANGYGVSYDLLRKIAYCETHFNPGAQNGPYGGMFQFTMDTWQTTRQQMGANADQGLRFGAKESIETAAWKIGHGGVDAWLNCSRY